MLQYTLPGHTKSSNFVHTSYMVVWIYPKCLSWTLPYLRLCDVTQPKSNMQNQIIKGFQEILQQIFIDVLILPTSNNFPKINQIYENYLYKMNFNFFAATLCHVTEILSQRLPQCEIQLFSNLQ